MVQALRPCPERKRRIKDFTIGRRAAHSAIAMLAERGDRDKYFFSVTHLATSTSAGPESLLAKLPVPVQSTSTPFEKRRVKQGGV